jgi:hypothetical protein
MRMAAHADGACGDGMVGGLALSFPLAEVPINIQNEGGWLNGHPSHGNAVFTRIRPVSRGKGYPQARNSFLNAPFFVYLRQTRLQCLLLPRLLLMLSSQGLAGSMTYPQAVAVKKVIYLFGVKQLATLHLVETAAESGISCA